MSMRRGGRKDLEIQHGRVLLDRGEASVWGWDTPAGKERVRRRVKWLRRVCDMKPGVNVLECGCGTGIFTRQLADSGCDITAVDISPDLLACARRECAAPNTIFVEDNLEEPSFLKDDSYDVICGVSVLHHLDVVKALKALRPKLKSGGRFAFSEPNLLNPINKYYFFVPDLTKRLCRGTSPNEMAFRPRELLQVFGRAGYTVDTLVMRDFLHPAIPKSLIPIAKWGERLAEAIPLIRLWAGSIWVTGRLSH